MEQANIKVGGRPIKDVIGSRWYRNVMDHQDPVKAARILRTLANELDRITVAGRPVVELLDREMLGIINSRNIALAYLTGVAAVLNAPIAGRPFYDWLGGVSEAGKLICELGVERLNELDVAGSLFEDIADPAKIKPEELRKAILDGEDVFYSYYLSLERKSKTKFPGTI